MKKKAKSPALPYANHVVCVWKQNDLGLYGRRPDRWIAYWQSHPAVEKVWVIEPPLYPAKLSRWFELAQQSDTTNASEYALLLSQCFKKRQGEFDTDKVQYLSAPVNSNLEEAFAVLANALVQQGAFKPMLVLWPICGISQQFINILKPKHVLVDLVDDQRAFKANTSQRETLTLQYQQLLSLADECISNSPGLISTFEAEFCTRIRLVPNDLLPQWGGLEQDALDNFKLRLTALKHAPVAGYVGNLRDRIDPLKLMLLVQGRPNWQFWFVGQTQGSEFYELAKGTPNCHFFGTLGKQQAMTVVQFFDLGLIPFENSELTNSMDLLKLQDYRANSKPTIDFRTTTLQSAISALAGA